MGIAGWAIVNFRSILNGRYYLTAILLQKCVPSDERTSTRPCRIKCILQSSDSRFIYHVILNMYIIRL